MWSGCAVRYRACRLGADRQVSDQDRECNKGSAASSRVREESVARRRVGSRMEGNRVGGRGVACRGVGFVAGDSQGYETVIPKAGRVEI
jgi:hypothetical protein